MGLQARTLGQCPMGCGATLVAALSEKMIRCNAPECPRPYAVSELITDVDTEHLVQLHENAGGWTVKHPLRERLRDPITGNDGLFDCTVSGLVDSDRMNGHSPDEDGTTYRVTVIAGHESDWRAQALTWEAID